MIELLENEHPFIRGLVHKCYEDCPAHHSEGNIALLGRAKSIGDHVGSSTDVMLESDYILKSVFELEIAWQSQSHT